MQQSDMQPTQWNRRKFLKASTAAAAGLGIVGAARAAGANDKVRAAVVGIGGRGESHIHSLMKLDNVEVAALCDVDEKFLDQRGKAVEEKTGQKPTRYVDMRRLFDDKSIDVVSFATPNHWHALGSIWALEAGKDVYVEKPCSHNIREGRKLADAARASGRVVQHGTQIRSSDAVQEGMELLRDGVIGDVYMAKGLCYKPRNSIGRRKEEPVPTGVDYDLWLGPAPERPFSRNRFHYNWHWHWDYGNGDIGNQGVHQLDVARWGLGVGLPRKVQSMGGHFMFDDDQETPNTQVATFSYPEEQKMLVFEVRHWYTNTEDVGNVGRATIGDIFYGSEGILIVPSYNSYKVLMGKKLEPGPARTGRNDLSDAHFANFIEAVRKRDVGILHAPIEEGHKSAALCHLANIAYRVGRTLEFDPDTESCSGDAEANALLTRDYREPFVVRDVN
jgi:predicted dehydrogenase